MQRHNCRSASRKRVIGHSCNVRNDDAENPNADDLRQQIVEAINERDAEQILRVEVVLDGRANGSVRALFPFGTSRAVLNASMMRYAAGVLEREAEIWDHRATLPPRE
jgi:hypothetical protein